MPLPSLWLAASLSALAIAMPSGAQAQAYPQKPVKVVVAFTAGGTTDILARTVTQQLSEKLKQPFVIDNKPGAGGNLGTELVVRSAPDGYTLIVNSVGPIAVNPTLYGKLPYNPLTDLVPMVQIADVPNVLVIHPSVPANNMEELVAFAKANPGKLNYGSTGIGTSSHLSSFMLSKRVGFEATHIPYKGADALKDLLAGRIQFMFATIPSVMSHITAGKLKPIAVTGPRRSPLAPDIPTVAELYPGFNVQSMFGMVVASGTPRAVVQKIYADLITVLKKPEVIEKMAALGLEPNPITPDQFDATIKEDIERWTKLVKSANIKLD
jgi:tripartite-type tricarboxylate transporter receptor subunit TctC